MLVEGVLESNICQSSMIHCLGLQSEIEKTISTGVAVHDMMNENGLPSHTEREGEKCLWHPPVPDLALTQRDGTQFLGELHDISKLVEVSSRVSARGQHKDEGGGGGGLFEDCRQVCCLA